jgi:uncharacterized protein YndB with AHSA1/START domain
LASGEVRTTVIVEGTRSDVWHALTSVAGVTSWLAPGAEIHAVEGGYWKLALDSKGQALVDGGTIMSYARDQELIVAFNPPKSVKGLKPARLRLMIEPLRAMEQRVIVLQEPMGDGPEWDRVATHLTESWAGALDRLRRRMMLLIPTIGGYDPFWAGL